VEPPQQKSSFLHLQCLLNKTESRINTLTTQIKAQQARGKPSRVDKKGQKQMKAQEKEQRVKERQLNELERRC
jgi:hypothetical protein